MEGMQLGLFGVKGQYVRSYFRKGGRRGPKTRTDLVSNMRLFTDADIKPSLEKMPLFGWSLVRQQESLGRCVYMICPNNILYKKLEFLSAYDALRIQEFAEAFGAKVLLEQPEGLAVEKETQTKPPFADYELREQKIGYRFWNVLVIDLRGKSHASFGPIGECGLIVIRNFFNELSTLRTENSEITNVGAG